MPSYPILADSLSGGAQEELKNRARLALAAVVV